MIEDKNDAKTINDFMSEELAFHMLGFAGATEVYHWVAVLVVGVYRTLSHS
jgi:hypothetical protein